MISNDVIKVWFLCDWNNKVDEHIWCFGTPTPHFSHGTVEICIMDMNSMFLLWEWQPIYQRSPQTRIRFNFSSMHFLCLNKFLISKWTTNQKQQQQLLWKHMLADRTRCYNSYTKHYNKDKSANLKNSVNSNNSKRHYTARITRKTHSMDKFYPHWATYQDLSIPITRI